jgi:hypothetical protein
MDLEGYNRQQLRFLDIKAREIHDLQYGHCIQRCSRDMNNMRECKQECFSSLVVPYKYMMHSSKSDEDNSFKKCLSKKLPNIQQADYFECSKGLYTDRVKIISDFIGNSTERVFKELH